MIDQRVLVITGASSGVGEALALRATRAGFAVIAVGRNEQALQALDARVALEGNLLTHIVGDVRLTETSRHIAHMALERYGRIDVLVANAGVAARGPLAMQSDEALREQLDTHVIAPIVLIRETLDLLRVHNGSVFVIGSGVARIPIGGMGLYPASKAALRSASRTLRRELAPLGISLTYVDPGVVDTVFMERAGMPGAPWPLRISAHGVARRILHAMSARPRELAAVPWQTLLVGVAELLPRLTDTLLEKANAMTGVTESVIDEKAILQLHASRAALMMDISGTRQAPTPSLRPAIETVRSETTTPPSHSATTTLETIANTADVLHHDLASSSIPPGISVPSINGSAGDYDYPTTGIGEYAPRRGMTATFPATNHVTIAAETVDEFSQSLAPIADRMRRLSLRASMVRDLFREAGHEVDEESFALSWVGMPNKNERRLVSDLFEQLRSTGYLLADASGTLRTTRALATDGPTTTA